MEKPEQVLSVDKENLPNHYRFLLQRINGYASTYSTKAILCFDSQDEGNDQIISNKMKNYLFRSSEGNNCNSIVESAFFVSSKVEDGIQLADFCAGIVRHYNETVFGNESPDNFQQWIHDLYAKVQLQTCTVFSPNGDQELFPIYKMPARFFKLT